MPHRWWIRLISRLIPRRFRSEWQQEWEAELHYLSRRARPDSFRRSAGAFWDALAMQPRRMEEDMFQDLRYGLRMMMKEPGFTIVAVLALTLGIGMNTAIFSLVNAALIEPLPYKDPDQVVRILETYKPNVGGFSPLDYLDWKTQTRTFEGIAAFQNNASSMVTSEGVERIPGMRVSADFLPLLGVQPVRGRFFLPEEDRAGGNRVVILSHAIWTTHFGGDPNIIGKHVTLDSQIFEVIGVMDAGFGVIPAPVGLLMPLRLGDESHNMRRTERYLNGIGRIKSGISFDDAQNEMNAIAERLAEAYPEANTNVGVRLVPLRNTLVATDLRSSLPILFGAVGFVLLIACSNFANLLLLRTATRQKEIAIRLAVGAGRLRIMRQWLTETVLLTSIAAVAGMLAAYWTVQAAIPFLKSIGGAFYFPVSRLENIGLNSSVVVFSLAISLSAALISGAIPAARSARLSRLDVLKETGRQRGGNVRGFRIRNVLVVAEISLALMLLAGAGLLINSFGRILQVDLGFDPQRILTVAVSMPSSNPAGFHQSVLERIATLPGVQAASMVNNLPLMGVGNGTSFTIENRPPSSPADVSATAYRIIGPNYFRTLGVPVLRGREFTDADAGEPSVVVINETMARTIWPGEDPVGRRIRRGGINGFGPWLTIAGVIRDVSIYGPADQPRTELYFPHAQFAVPGMALVIRTESDPLALASLVRAQIRAVDASAPITNIQTMEQVLSRVVAPRRLNMLLLTVFAAAALVLAAIGIYGVTSYSVAQRTHEIGVRMALGATRRDVLRLVCGQGWRLAFIGIAIGLTGAVMISGWISSLLFGVSPTDPATLAAVVLLLFGAVLLACYIAARRATDVDPLIALKQG